MNLRRLLLTGAGLGSAALAACGGQTLPVQPAAATLTVSSSPAASGAAPAQPAAGGDCDTGAWTGAISPEGRPDSLDAGDAGAVYVWHDAGGWHVRSTDARPVDHHYTGTIRLAPAAASFADLRTVRTERDDRVLVDGTNVLHYDFHTFASIDGVDFRVTCPAGRRAERLAFHTEFDGHPIADRVRIGDTKRSPRSADFPFVRPA
jgi:hypothetical protein